MRHIIFYTILFCFLSTKLLAANLDLAVKAYDSKDYEVALSEFETLAAQGSAKAQFYLAVMYSQGFGVQRDVAVKMKWFHKAAEQGLAAAQNNLGIIYSRGIGVEKNLAEAVSWYRKAAYQGHANAQYEYGMMHYYSIVSTSQQQRYMWMEIATRNGSKEAAKVKRELARKYDNGVIHFAKKVANWCIKSNYKRCRK